MIHMSIRSHDRDLEKFTGGPNKPAQFRMRVSLSRYGVLSFNKNAYAELGKPAAVYLYFSRLRDLSPVCRGLFKTRFELHGQTATNYAYGGQHG